MNAQEYLKFLSNYRVDPACTDKNRLEGIKPFLSMLDNVEKSSIALFDMALMDYSFLTSNFKFLISDSKPEPANAGMSFFFSRIHEADREMFFDTSVQAFSFLNTKEPEERKKYRTCQDFRIQRDDGSWIRLIQQMLAVELDNKGNIWLVLLVNDISPVHDQTIPGRRYMEYIPSQKRVLFPASDAAAQSPLTKRELEILGFVSNGYPSREIADFLGISSVTVNNHRQNILSKLGAASSAEAVSYAKNIGLMK